MADAALDAFQHELDLAHDRITQLIQADQADRQKFQASIDAINAAMLPTLAKLQAWAHNFPCPEILERTGKLVARVNELEANQNKAKGAIWGISIPAAIASAIALWKSLF